MITEDYVSFETAKLLKEKGFDCLCHSYFRKNNPNNLVKETCGANWNDTPFFTSRPTLQMAMKWLREVHNIIIEPESVWNGKKWEYQLFIVTPQNADFPYYKHNTYKSYEECVEAAIKYCIEQI